MENLKEYKHCPNKIAHLQMIQGVIDRMGGNLFFLRGWSITLLAGLFAISTSETLSVTKWAPLLFFILLILFWLYDGYFLSLERKFRGLYDKVRKLSEEETPVSLSTILNSLDGLLTPEGLVFFITTNHPEKLDKALIRPGRIDLIKEFNNANEFQIGALFDRFLPNADRNDRTNFIKESLDNPMSAIEAKLITKII